MQQAHAHALQETVQGSLIADKAPMHCTMLGPVQEQRRAFNLSANLCFGGAPSTETPGPSGAALDAATLATEAPPTETPAVGVPTSKPLVANAPFPEALAAESSAARLRAGVATFSGKPCVKAGVVPFSKPRKACAISLVNLTP